MLWSIQSRQKCTFLVTCSLRLFVFSLTGFELGNVKNHTPSVFANEALNTLSSCKVRPLFPKRIYHFPNGFVILDTQESAFLGRKQRRKEKDNK
jgi:hypothetical protein